MTSSLIHSIFRFGLPTGTAFVIVGIHELAFLWEAIFGIIFQILDLFNLHKKKDEIKCDSMPFAEEELLHPHEYTGTSEISWSEDFVYSLLLATAILAYLIGFILKGSKHCLLLWLVLSGVILFLRIRYYIFGDIPDTAGRMTSRHLWTSFQITMALIRQIFMTALGILYIRGLYYNTEDFGHDDLKPIGMGIKGFIKYYTSNIREALMAIGIAALLDVVFIYISSMPANFVVKEDFVETIAVFVGIEVTPYVILIVGLCLGSVKWIEIWRAAFLAILFIWGAVVIVSFAVAASMCDPKFFMNVVNVLNYFIIVYVFIYKFFLYRVSLLYVKKYRNAPIEMEDLTATDQNGISNIEIVNDSRVPFVNHYEC